MRNLSLCGHPRGLISLRNLDRDTVRTVLQHRPQRLLQSQFILIFTTKLSAARPSTIPLSTELQLSAAQLSTTQLSTELQQSTAQLSTKLQQSTAQLSTELLAAAVLACGHWIREEGRVREEGQVWGQVTTRDRGAQGLACQGHAPLPFYRQQNPLPLGEDGYWVRKLRQDELRGNCQCSQNLLDSSNCGICFNWVPKLSAHPRREQRRPIPVLLVVCARYRDDQRLCLALDLPRDA